jgi:hypothetical protein
MMQVKQSTKKRRHKRETRERKGREVDDACQAINREKAPETPSRKVQKRDYLSPDRVGRDQ